MAEKVSDAELIRRMTFLSKRFPDYKLRFYTYYHYGVKKELTKLEIPFEEYHGLNYDSYAEDIQDVGIYLNIDKTEMLDFTMDIENEQIFWGRFGIDEDKDMLLLIFNKAPPKSLIIENIKGFVKEIADTIFIDHKPLVFYKTTYTKRRYEQIVKDDDEETIKIYHDIEERKTKKIKID